MLTAYPACFFREEHGYSVIFPDLNWLSTCGDSLEEALAAAVDCMAGYLFDCHIDGEPVPAPSALEMINTKTIAKELDIPAEGAFINMITVDVEEYAKIHFERAVKKTLSIPYWMNKRALAMNINFSQLLQEALLTKIRQEH